MPTLPLILLLLLLYYINNKRARAISGAEGLGGADGGVAQAGEAPVMEVLGFPCNQFWNQVLCLY